MSFVADLILSFDVTKIFAGNNVRLESGSIRLPFIGSNDSISSISSSQKIILYAISEYAGKTSTLSPLTLNLACVNSISLRLYRESDNWRNRSSLSIRLPISRYITLFLNTQEILLGLISCAIIVLIVNTVYSAEIAEIVMNVVIAMSASIAIIVSEINSVANVNSVFIAVILMIVIHVITAMNVTLVKIVHILQESRIVPIQTIKWLNNSH